MIVLILAEIIKNRTRKLKIYLKETTLQINVKGKNDG